MHEIWVTKDIRLKVDRWGNVTLQQFDPIVSPAVVASSVHFRTDNVRELIEALQGVLRVERAELLRGRSAS